MYLYLYMVATAGGRGKPRFLLQILVGVVVVWSCGAEILAKGIHTPLPLSVHFPLFKKCLCAISDFWGPPNGSGRERLRPGARTHPLVQEEGVSPRQGSSAAIPHPQWVRHLP